MARRRRRERQPFKNALCQAHCPRPGFQYGSWYCACRRHRGHPGPHRACGRWEWTSDKGPITDIVTGKVHEA